MLKGTIAIVMGALALLSASAIQAHSENNRFRPPPQIEGAWKTEVTIRDCATNAALPGGPFPGLITFAAGGTVSESAPPPPNMQRGPGHGTWRRTGRNTFSEVMAFQRFDLTNTLLLGSQEIRATAIVADDSGSYTASGTFESKDMQGNTLFRGCSAVVATRLQ